MQGGEDRYVAPIDQDCQDTEPMPSLLEQTCTIIESLSSVDENDSPPTTSNKIFCDNNEKDLENDDEKVGDDDEETGGDTDLDEQQKRRDTEDRTIIGEKESKQVLRLRIGLILALVVSASLVAFGAYYYTRYSEMTKFEENFTSDATKVLQSIGYGIFNTFAGLDSFATNFVSYADATNTTFPYINIPDYSNRVAKLQSMSLGLATGTFVIVTAEERRRYQNFAWRTKPKLVNQTLERQAMDPNYYGPKFKSVALSYSFHDDYAPLPYNITRNFCVLSQVYPITSAEFPAFNWDYYSTYENAFVLRLKERGKPVLGKPYILPDPAIPAEVENAQYWTSVYKSLVGPNEISEEPVSDIAYPIYNTLSTIQSLDNVTADPTTMVGVVSSFFYWRDTLKNVLPEGRRGIHVVIDNACQASFTYQINGNSVQYLGRGDHHEEKYNHLGIHESFVSLKNYSSVETRYTGIPIDEEFCQFTINIYPSSTMQDSYMTKNPAIFATIAILIFVFTSLVFLLYDWQVEHRQKLVLNTATRSTAVLTSLFPSQVRDKILEESNPTATATTSNDYENNTKPRKDIKSFLMGRDNMIPPPESSLDLIAIHDSPPIADLYPETTVFFADIAGFTEWSSSRTPNQVFLLLETLYGSFDSIARLHKVFKVETIGDSYVAVAGLPDPMKNHASVMVKFALRILSRTNEVMVALADRLGQDTVELNIRIGLNSGPTTAGVLRGEKSRFQLFGDTVNTAARMEASGYPGRIHCTQRTADYLTEAGKGIWLSKRQDLVEAKGKGTLQTYWIHPTTSDSATNTNSNSNQEAKSFVSEFK